MPLDAMTLSALAQELRAALTGMRIDKIRNPERDILLLSLRGDRACPKLLICAGAGSARVHFTTAEFENPQSPPMFCMLLRKHLQGGRIAEVTQPESERMLTLEIDSASELGELSRKKLVVEMMGRGANIILVGPDGRIIDCLRRVDAESSEKRQVLPGLFYKNPPKQEKTDFLASTPRQRRELWESAPGDKAADKWLVETFAGVSPLICRELCHRAFAEASPRISEIPRAALSALPASMDALVEAVRLREWTPVLLTREGEPFDFSFLRISQYGSAVRCEDFSSFSELLDAFYTRRDKAERQRRKAADILKTVKNAKERVIRRLEAQRSELKLSEKRDVLRQKGDLLTANLHRLKKGMDGFYASNFYLEGCPELFIELDPTLTPSRNAANYYRAYNKAKSAEKYLTERIQKGEQEYEYLCSVLEETERAEGERELSEIREELAETGYIKRQASRKNAKKKKNAKSAEAAPRRFVSASGFEILVGRNNAQNDALTLKTAHKSDIWLHAQKAHGAHVIISCGGREPDGETLLEAASLAAWYSQLRGSAKAPVDYTRVRHVKKPAGSLPGRVIYTDYKTIIAVPGKMPE